MASQAIRLILQFGSTAVLARLLTPDDYGLIAMVAVVSGFIDVIKDAGLSMATVQRSAINHEQVSTLFWANAALGVLTMVVLAVSAPLIAWIYGEPRLIWIAIAFSLIFVPSGLSAQHMALLRRQMRFTTLAAMDIISMSAGIAVAITMALTGFGYWSLVGLPAARTVVYTALCWIFSGWIPGPPRRRVGTRSMLSFGGSMTGFNILNYITRNADNLIVGSVLGSAALGYYSRAYNLLLLPIRQINGPIGAVALPTLCRLQDDPERYRRYFLRATSLISLVTLPVVAFVFADTRSFVLTLLGDQWMQVIPIFQWLAPAAAFSAINFVPGWLCISLGKPGRQFRWAIVSAPLTLAAFAISVQFGVVAVAAAFSMTWCLLFAGFIAYACKGSPVSLVDLLRALGPVLLACTVAGVVVLLLNTPLRGYSPVVKLAIEAVAFGFCYFAVWSVVGDRNAIFDLVRTMLARVDRKVA